MNRWAKDKKLARWSVSPFFLESGYVDLRDFYGADNILFADYADPGSVYYPESITSHRADTGKIPYLDEAVSDGSPPAQPERGYAAGMDSESFKGTLDGDGLGKKRTLWWNSNPDYCTGKLKLLMQSQLGQKDLEPGSDKELEIPLLNYAVANKLSLSYALHTTEDYEYFLLTISSNTITAQKLTTSTTGKLFDRLASADDDEKLKIESYLLGRARPGGESLEAEFNAVEGTPFALGWKSNWAGDELVIVTNEAYLDGLSDPIYHIQRLYTLSVSIEKSESGDYTLTANSTKNEQVNCTPTNNVFVYWYPNFALGVMQTHPWHALGGYSGGVQIEEAAAPMYAHYGLDDDGNEALIVYRHTLQPTESDGATVSELNIAQAAYSDAQTVCGAGSLSGTMTWATNFATEGVYIEVGGASANRDGLDNKTGARATEFDISVAETGLAPDSNSGTLPGFGSDTCDGTVDSSWLDSGVYPITRHQVRFDHYRRTSSNATITGDSVLILPYIGEDCVYTGTLTGYGAESNYQDQWRHIVGRISSQIIDADTKSQFTAGGNGGQATGGLTTSFAANSPLNGVTQYDKEYDVTFAFRGYHRSQPAVTLHVESASGTNQAEADADAYFQLGSWAELFDPQLFGQGAGISERLLLAQESAGTGVVIYTRDPTIDLNDETGVTDNEIPGDVRPVTSGVFAGWV